MTNIGVDCIIRIESCTHFAVRGSFFAYKQETARDGAVFCYGVKICSPKLIVTNAGKRIYANYEGRWRTVLFGVPKGGKIIPLRQEGPE